MCDPYMRYDCVHHDFIAFAEVQNSLTSNHPMGKIGRDPKPRVMSVLVQWSNNVRQSFSYSGTASRMRRVAYGVKSDRFLCVSW